MATSNKWHFFLLMNEVSGKKSDTVFVGGCGLPGGLVYPFLKLGV